MQETHDGPRFAALVHNLPEVQGLWVFNGRALLEGFPTELTEETVATQARLLDFARAFRSLETVRVADATADWFVSPLPPNRWVVAQLDKGSAIENLMEAVADLANLQLDHLLVGEQPESDESVVVAHLITTLETIKHRTNDILMAGHRVFQFLLPNTQELEQAFKSAHICYRPKNYVGGDFYQWRMGSTGRMHLALGDSTGHGVEGLVGATMGMSLLSRTMELPTTTSLLTKFNHFNRLFQQNCAISDREQRHDVNTLGYELMLAYYEPKLNFFRYVSAGIDLVHIRPTSDDLPVMYLPKNRSFLYPGGWHLTLNEFVIELQPGDRVLLFTDGLIDQIGGHSYKKLGRTRLQEILTDTRSLDVRAQGEALANELDRWRGGHEVTDDVCAIFLESN